MNQSPHKLLIRRILVALDGSPHSQAALEAAAHLAELLRAELMGVFVEDVNLLRLAELPFAQEVRRHTATIEKLEVRYLHRQLQRQAEQAQADLKRVANAHALSATFRVARGPVSAEVLAAALEADLLALGRISHAGPPRLGSTAKTAVAQTSRPVLLMRPGLPFAQPILLVYDGSPGAERALEVAAYLAGENGRLQVLLWAENAQQALAQEEAIRQSQQPKGLNLQFRRLTQPDVANFAYLVRLSGTGLMVLSDTNTRLPTAVVHTLLEELDHPILLVR